MMESMKLKKKKKINVLSIDTFELKKIIKKLIELSLVDILM